MPRHRLLNSLPIVGTPVGRKLLRTDAIETVKARTNLAHFRDRLGSASPAGVRSAAVLALETGRRVSYARSRWGPPVGSRPSVRLAVCAIFRDEAPYLAEWVAFHRLQGVERFWLYDNRSTDDWAAMLEPELVSGVVSVTPWDRTPGQRSAYADCLRRQRNHARWIAFIDIDEFLFSPTGEPVTDVLRAFDTRPGVAVNWRTYGVNGYQQRPDGLVIESYLLRAADDHPLSRTVKSIVYPRKTRPESISPHFFRHLGSAVGENGDPVAAWTREPPTANLLRINHYPAKSLDEWARKYARPRAWDGESYETPPPPPDQIRDDVILQFVPAMREALAARPRHSIR